MGATEQQFATFIAEFPASRIPKEILHIGKRLLLNDIGVGVFAAKDPALDILLKMFEREGGNKRASIIGTGVRTTLVNAALANGFLGHFEDYDDTHLSTVVHTASPIFPAALAAGESVGASGADVLAAGTLGIEIACRLGRLIAPRFREGADFWHITNTCGVFGAATAASRLLGLSPAQIEHALGLAGTQAHGLREVFGSMAKPFHAGKAAANGLTAALLAKDGFTSISANSKGILEGSRGFVSVMVKDYDISELTRDLGSDWRLPEIAIKSHACGQANQSMLDALNALRKLPGVNPDNVTAINGWVQEMAPAIATRRHPKKGLEGKFSYHHALACILIDGHAYPSQFTDTRVNDPLVISLRDRTTVTEDPSIARRAARVSVTLRNGETHTQDIQHSVGSPGNPLSDEGLDDKFRALAGEVWPKEIVARASDALWSIEKAGNVGKVMAILNQPIKIRARRGKTAAKPAAQKKATAKKVAAKKSGQKKRATEKAAPKRRR